MVEGSSNNSSEPISWSESREFYIELTLLIGGVLSFAAVVRTVIPWFVPSFDPVVEKDSWARWIDYIAVAFNVFIASVISVRAFLDLSEYKADLVRKDRLGLCILGSALAIAIAQPVLHRLVPESTYVLRFLLPLSFLSASYLFIRAKQQRRSGYDNGGASI